MILDSNDIETLQERVHRLENKSNLVSYLHSKGFMDHYSNQYEICHIAVLEIKKLKEKRINSLIRALTLIPLFLILRMLILNKVDFSTKEIVSIFSILAVVCTLITLYFSNRIKHIKELYIQKEKN